VIRLNDWAQDPANSKQPSANGRDPSSPNARDQLIRLRIQTGNYQLPHTQEAIAQKLSERWCK